MMPPSSRGLGVSRAQVEPMLCLRCRFRFSGRSSSSNRFSSRLSLLPVGAHPRSQKLSSLAEDDKLRIRGVGKGRNFSEARLRPKRLCQSSPQQYNERIRHQSALNQSPQGIAIGTVVAFNIKRTFATHADLQPSKQDDPLKFFRTNQQGKVDIKTRLKAWQQEYNNSDEAARPYVSSLGSSSSICVKPSANTDVVHNPRLKAIKEDDEDFGYDDYLEDATKENFPITPGLEAGFLKKGDLVELFVGGSYTLSIFLRAIGVEHEFLTMSGTLIHRRMISVYLSISSFASPEQIAPLLNQLPERMSDQEDVDTWAPRETSAPLIQRMLDFDRAAKDFYQKYASQIDNIYNVIAHDREYRYYTTRQITARIIGEPDPFKIKPTELLAVHRAILMSPVGFNTSDRYHRFTHNFEIVPKQTVKVFNKALVWLRDLQEASMNQVYSPNPQKAIPFRIKDNPIGAFLRKCRSLIRANRLHRPVTKMGRVGPDNGTSKRIQESGEIMRLEKVTDFTPDEECLITFLRFWTLEHNVRGPYSDALDALGSRLVRATGCYSGFDFEIHKATGFMFLQEIGAILPWENRAGYAHRARIRDFFPGLRIDRMARDASAFTHSWKQNPPIDAMKELRKDWGSLEVFNIDPAYSSIVDDGVSVENVQDEPAKYWVHVHVANPTAYIRPGSPIARFAQEVGTTVHLPEKSHPMLNQKITREFSVNGPNKPVLTFSAKLDLDGNLHGTEISSGIVHNCIKMDNDSVREAMNPESSDISLMETHYVGEWPGSREMDNAKQREQAPQHVNEDHLSKLRLIQKLVSARTLLRPDWDILRFRDTAAAVVTDFPFGRHTDFHNRQSLVTSARVFGDPQIRVRSTRFDPKAGMHRLMVLSKIVDDAMILACEVAGLWCKERNIPSIYRGTVRNNEVLSANQFRERILKPALERTGGTPPFLLIQEYARLATRSVLSAVPVKHDALGLEVYLRVTSPLRRYQELIAHWQIEAALRYEHETGKSLVGCKNPDSILPFSRATIEAMFIHMIELESVTNFASTHTQLSWIVMFFFRAHYFGQGELPPTLKVFLRRRINAHRVSGTLEIINIDVRVQETEVSGAEGGLQIGDWWECKIVDVDTYKCRIYLEPVKLVERMANELCLDLQKFIEVNPTV